MPTVFTYNPQSQNELIELEGFPASYAGQAAKYLRVKGAEDGVEFAVPPSLFTGLTDTPSDYIGEALKLVRVKMMKHNSNLWKIQPLISHILAMLAKIM